MMLGTCDSTTHTWRLHVVDSPEDGLPWKARCGVRCTSLSDMDRIEVLTNRPDIAPCLKCAPIDAAVAAAPHLNCDMTKDCNELVTWIDEKGFAYCTDHGVARRSYRAARKLTERERARLAAGNTIWWDPELNLPQAG